MLDAARYRLAQKATRAAASTGRRRKFSGLALATKRRCARVEYNNIEREFRGKNLSPKRCGKVGPGPSEERDNELTIY